MKITRNRIVVLTALLLTSFLMAACSSSETIIVKTADDYFNAGVKALENENWLDATKYFEVIKFQYPASQYADDAQYYLAEVNFRRSEYLLAAYNYSTLRRVYPNSDFRKESLFKTALCYFKMSPSYDRDQEYTRKAIQTFSEFQLVYPDDSLYNAASKNIAELRNKLARKNYSIAALYRTLDNIESALVYYNIVIEEFPDSEYFEPAYFGKIEALSIMRKYEYLRGVVQLYKQLFPTSQRLSQVKEIENSLPY